MATLNLVDRTLESAKAKAGERIEMWDKHTRGLCFRVSPDRKVWVVRYRAAGRQRRYVLGEYPAKGLADARIEAATILRDARKIGADPAGDAQKVKAEALAQPIKTFRQLAEAYLQACRDGHWKPRGKSQGERTLKDARESLDRYVLPEIGDMALGDVTRPVIRQFLRNMAARGIRAQTNTALSVIRRIYNYAIAEFEGKLVAVNVAAGHPRETETPRSRVMSDTELKSFWIGLKAPAEVRLYDGPDDAKGEPVQLSRPMAILLQLALLVLQRRKEFAGAMASELNLDQALWLIPGERMKAGKPHLVPLPPTAVELFREALQIAEAVRPELEEGEDRPNDFPVFPSPRNRAQAIKPPSVTHAMKFLTTGLGFKSVSPHDLRRTGSTALTSERLSVSPFIRSLVLSHTTTGGGAAVSGRHYDANTYIAEKRRALEAWEGLVLEIVGERMRPSNVEPLRQGAA